MLYSTSPLEARLTMRAINLSSEGIGAAGAQELVGRTHNICCAVVEGMHTVCVGGLAS